MLLLYTTNGVPASEFCLDFVQGMLDRMGISFFKYGLVEEAYPEKVNAIESLKLRLQKYEETGNTEYLIDAGNFAMIEFMRPRHPKAFFKPTEHPEDSPGRVWESGAVTQASNTVGRSNVRLGGSNMRTDGGHYKREGD